MEQSLNKIKNMVANEITSYLEKRNMNRSDAIRLGNELATNCICCLTSTTKNRAIKYALKNFIGHQFEPWRYYAMTALEKAGIEVLPEVYEEVEKVVAYKNHVPWPMWSIGHYFAWLVG